MPFPDLILRVPALGILIYYFCLRRNRAGEQVNTKKRQRNKTLQYEGIRGGGKSLVLIHVHLEQIKPHFETVHTSLIQLKIMWPFSLSHENITSFFHQVKNTYISSLEV